MSHLLPRLSPYEAQKLAHSVEWLLRRYRKAQMPLSIVFGRALREMLSAAMTLGVEYIFMPGEPDAPVGVTWRMLAEEPGRDGVTGNTTDEREVPTFQGLSGVVGSSPTLATIPPDGNCEVL